MSQSDGPVTVPERPDLAGVDPHHALDWVVQENDDNIDRVTIGD